MHNTTHKTCSNIVAESYVLLLLFHICTIPHTPKTQIIHMHTVKLRQLEKKERDSIKKQKISTKIISHEERHSFFYLKKEVDLLGKKVYILQSSVCMCVLWC